MAQGKIYESDTVWVNYCGYVELRRSGSNHDWQLGDVSRGVHIKKTVHQKVNDWHD